MRDSMCDKYTLDWTSWVTWPLQNNSTDADVIVAQAALVDLHPVAGPCR